MTQPALFKLGLIINSYAGLGGSVALKGSDGAETAQRALALGAEPKAPLRVKQALSVLLPYQEQLYFVTGNAGLGEQVLTELGFRHQVIYASAQEPTGPEDTRA